MTVKQISVRTSRTHWRAGMLFTKGKPQVLDLDKLNDTKLGLLEDDAEILIEELEGEAIGSDDAVTKPEDEAEILTSIQNAVLMSLSVKTDFTKAGKPRVDALEKALGWKASSDEIELALDQMNEEQKAQMAGLLEG
ncbi:hypothetical protein [uncultured Cohaesibacter sp.]|uniref:hypothetical protein n=1 Tax=uncultured Cohaesibacter sp. TaxID=1002546 RepID=UPI002AAB85F5|nr:hypothetical protein [uncultured Cohaesibacter sp.]